MLDSGIQLISRTNLTIFILISFWLIYGLNIVLCCSDIFSNHIGTTTNDMVIEEGQPMEVGCTLFKSSMDLTNGTKVKINSEMLLFKYNGTRIQNSKIQRIDNFTIKYQVKRTTMKENGYYMCYIDIGLPDVKPRAVCATYITIAHAPSPSDNFNLKCAGFDLKNFTCQWDLQDYNLVTDYQLSLIVHEKFNYSTCPNRIFPDTCTFTTRDPYPYLISDKQLRFRLDVSNKFGSTFKIYDIDHYSNVILDSISSLNFIKIGSQDVAITWDPPNSIADDPYLEEIAEYLLKVYPIERDGTLTTIGADNLIRESKFVKIFAIKGIRQFNLTNLIPYTRYQVEIRCRLVTNAGEGKWSKELIDHIQTKPDVPYTHPILHPGGYEIVQKSASSVDVIVYYDKVDKIYSNGPDLTIMLRVETIQTTDTMKSSPLTVHSFQADLINSPSSIQSGQFSSSNNTNFTLQLEPSSIKFSESRPSLIIDNSVFRYDTNFTNLEWSSFRVQNLNASFDLQLTMSTFNSLGFDNNSSIIVIPGLSRSKVHPGVDQFYAINWNGNNYTLYWKVDKPKETIKNFTIFWCEVIDTPQCDHHINHIDVPMDFTSVELSINYDKVQFGISVIDAISGLSSGIKWTECIESGSFLQIKNRFKRFNLISIGTKSVLANWILDCPALYQFINNYEIHFCRIDQSCSKTLTIIDVDKLLTEYNIINLESNTGYNFTIYAITSKGQRLESSTITIETKVDVITLILAVSVIIGTVILILTTFYILLVCTMRKREDEKKLKKAVDSNWIPKMPSRLKGDANILLNPLAQETRNEYENKEYMNSDSNTNINKLNAKGFNSRYDQQLTQDCKNNVIILSTISGNNQLNDIIPCETSLSSSSVSPSTSSSSSTIGEPDEGLELTCSMNNQQIVSNRKSLIKSFSSVSSSSSSSSSRKIRSRKLSDAGSGGIGGCDSEDSGYSTKLSDKNVYYRGDSFTIDGIIKSIDENSPYIVVPEDKISGISIGNIIKSSNDNIVDNHNNNVTINRSLSDSDISCYNEQTTINDDDDDDYHPSLPMRTDYLPSLVDYNQANHHNYLHHGNNQDNNQNEPDDVNTISNGYVYA